MPLSQEEIFSQLRALLAKKLDLPEEEFSLDKTLRDDLDLDSMTLLEVVMEIEIRFSIHLDQREADQWKNLDDLVKAISQRQTP
jgi:acyl carrier protein